MLKSEKLIIEMIGKFNLQGEAVEYLKNYEKALKEENEAKYGNIERIVIVNERELSSLSKATIYHMGEDSDDLRERLDRLYEKLNSIKKRLFYPKKKGE